MSDGYTLTTKPERGYASIEDPLGDETHEFEDGEVIIPHADSAAALHDANTFLVYAEDGPTEREIEAAQEERLGEFATDLIVGFEASRGRVPGEQALDSSAGFDPKTESPRNIGQVRIQKVYNRCLEAGRTAEAEYLARLPGGRLGSEQEKFRRYLRTHAFEEG